ncbi:sensor histidine kinase [Sphingomonas sp. R-74633]|uniref:sensor histidine kinase n=1 Tax=Sphingomonas sp. R-74633 TaxID=2751188 RepID=UPI0015D2EF15|nr:ATP-binding protein [Sphingomonas sp. R-74633]NYT42337.1 sensor histidine kinase [Sphingomonas sp. R-74633]
MSSGAPFTRQRILTAALTLAVILLLAWTGSRWATGQARGSADAVAQQTARAHVGLLNSELQKFRLLPLVLSENPEIAPALRGGDPAAQRGLNATLELLATRTDAAVIYVIDRQGRTVAASNWRLPTSFVGQVYGFRPYFRDAMERGASELFALGTVSGRPGLYLARRVDRDGLALGVVVVKVEFDDVEAAWARAPGITIVTDAHGVILVTSIPGWRFQTTRALDVATLADARRTLQFGPKPPKRAPVTIAGATASVGADGKAQRYRAAAEPAPLAGAHLIHLAPLEPPLAAARTQALLIVLAILLAAGLLAVFALRAAEKRRLMRHHQARLEAEVERRTAELREANALLIVESEERIEADRRYRAAREELAQASRLGSLGQITAGVAHEINQPVAAIRTFAENAATFLERAAPDKAGANLKQIVSLTERIGTITAELRAFARRKTPAEGNAALGSVLDGTLLLLGERARGVVTLKVSKPLRAVAVRGDRIRLEQILINLLQNALDAVGTTKEARVIVEGARDGDLVRISVIDNGPGVDPEIADTLFSPFTTAKPGGLGLGLAIARDIAREFRGDIAHTPNPAGGAVFHLSLRTA